MRGGHVEGHVTVPEAERAFGMRGGFSSWVTKNCTTDIKKHRGVRLVPYAMLEQFLARRTRGNVTFEPKKPHGWLTRAQAAEIAGVDGTLFWQLARQRRTVRGAYVTMSRTIYYHPDDVERVRIEYGNRPLPGWLHVATVNAEGGASSKNTLSEHLRRHKHEVRWFRHPETKRRNRYCRAEVAAAWLQKRCRS